jgi:hypothetical protein
MALKRNVPINANVVAVATKDSHRRPVPKTYSYRYEVGADAGPAGDPIVRAGAAIIEGRYRGRSASWHVGRSTTGEKTYLATGSYVHPLAENPMAYPAPHVPAAMKQTRTPGFAASAAQKIRRAPLTRVESVPDRAAATQIGAPSRREARRPTPANEPAYRKTG